MPSDPEFVTLVTDSLACIGEIRARAMFGGHGVYCDDLMVAIVVEDQLYFKADDTSQPIFVQAGLQPFTYMSRGKSATMRYHQAPPDVFDDSDIMLHWATLALAAARRAATKKARR